MYVFLLMPLPPSPMEISKCLLIRITGTTLVSEYQKYSAKSRNINNFKAWTENTDRLHIIEGTCSYTLKFPCDSSLIIDPLKNFTPTYTAITDNNSVLIMLQQ
jgi:hypothetical protein